MKVAVVVNPISGVRGGPPRGLRRAEFAGEVLHRLGHEFEILVADRPGHAVELAAAAVARGAEVVCAWGGDGTVNEVGRAVAFSPAALGIVPSGSGNGLARGLGLPRDPLGALRVATSRRRRAIDVGEIGGRLFFNVAGFGFDAHVARLFAERAEVRGLRRYVTIVARELFSFAPSPLAVTCGDAPEACSAFLLTIANGPQWGNGAVIAPGARLDDGLLDLVIVEIPSRVRLVRAVPSLFTGRVGRQPGVRMRQVTSVRVAGAGPLRFHVDGEPAEHPGGELTITVRPGGLLVAGAPDPPLQAVGWS